MGNNIQSSHIKKSVTTVNLNIKFKWLFQWKFKSFTKERVYIMTLKIYISNNRIFVLTASILIYI